jgi:hypothetical protein
MGKRNGLTLVAVLCVLSVAAPAHAATFVVNNTGDAGDFSSADGKCQTGAANGVCTLRAAVEQADSDAAADTIVLPAGTYIRTTNTPLTVTNPLEIDGPAPGSGVATVDAAGTGTRVLVNQSTLTLTNITLTGGASGTDGAGIANFGASAALTLDHARVTSSTAAQHGGGIYNEGTLWLVSSTVDANHANQGGGVFGAAGSALNVDRSSIWDNKSDQGLNPTDAGIQAAGTATISNSTIAGNVSNTTGGGLDVAAGGTATLSDSTIASNTATSGAGLTVAGGASATVTRSIVASSALGNCTVAGTLTATHSIETATDCGFTGGGANQQSTDPRLGPLQDNGGPTLTMAPSTASPALDQISAGCPASDQRGIARPQGPAPARCDVGAVELVRADLSVTGAAAPAPGLDGQDETFTFVVTNGGPDSAAHAELRIALPTTAAAQLVSAPAECTGTATLTCALGALDPGEHHTLDVVVKPTAAGTLSLTAIAGSDAVDVVPDNDEATPRISIAPAADLSFTSFTGPAQATVGRDLTYTLTIRNEGPDPASGARLVLTGPKTRLAAITSQAATAGRCFTTEPFTCMLGTLDAGASETVVFTVRARGAGTYPWKATLTADPADPDPADNSAALTTTAVKIATPAPVLSGLHVAPRQFRTGGARGGTTIRFRLSRGASVTFQVRGPILSLCNRIGKRQVCRRTAPVRGSFGATGARGSNRVRFRGILRGRLLRRGFYSLTARPRRGGPRSTSFIVTGVR